MHTSVTLSCCAAAACLAVAAHGEPPVIRGIGVPAGSLGSYAAFVTADGSQVFGTATSPTQYPTGLPVVWSLAEGLRVLPNPGTPEGVYALGMSDDGSRLFTASNWAPGDNRVWRWEGRPESGVWTPLPGFDTANLVAGPMVTADGLTVFASMSDENGDILPVRWTEQEGQTPFGEPGETLFWIPSASRDGSVVLGSMNGLPVRWTAATGWQPIPLDASLRGGTPMAVSGDGRVTCGYYIGGGMGMWLYDDRVESPATAIALNGNGALWSSSISGDGEVVVGGMQVIENSDFDAIIFTRSSGCLLLTQYLSLHGADISGWRLSFANAVSADGRTIVGVGEHEYAPGLTRREGWVVTVPSCPADMGMAGGEWGPDGALDNNDFIAFINRFFAGQIGADVGRAGGEVGRDGQFDNNDFIAFIALFFAGC